MPSFNVNTDAVVAYSNKLEKLSRSAFPVAVRQTLDSAAFDVKQKTMPLSAKRFDNRSPNFFKANSKVSKAQGFDLRKMKSEVGFIEDKLRLNNNFAVKDLEQQEHGGTIKKKSFIPMDDARKSGSKSPVRPSNRLSKIKGVLNAKNLTGSQKQRLIKAVKKVGRGGHFIGGSTEGKQTLFKVTSLTKKGKFKLKALYSFKENRTVNIKATGFMKKASLASGRKMERFYKENAKRQFEKALR